ncbi:ester cyclase [Streptomyces sp. NPDC001970]
MKPFNGRRRILGGVLSGTALAVVAVATPSVASDTDASRERPKEIVRGFYESYSQRDLDATWDRYIHPDAVMHVPGFDDRDSWLVADKQILAAFGDLTITVYDQVWEKDKVATRWRLGGHHTGELFGIPASGRYESFTATTVDRIQDHKIIDHWSDADFTAFLQRLQGSSRSETVRPGS